MIDRVNANRLGRGFVILAPPHVSQLQSHSVSYDINLHSRLLEDSQRLRGAVYLQDGAIGASQLTTAGLHVQPADSRSWHLLTIDRYCNVTACIRYMSHSAGLSYDDLSVSQTLAHQPAAFARQVERAVRAEVAKANALNFSYVELGGWVVGAELRCSTEAIRMLLMMYALSQALGGAIALSTATTRHNSSSILRRTGGRPLEAESAEVLPYFDPAYNCEMEMIAFDSRFPNPRYLGWIREFREALLDIPIICPASVGNTFDLLNLSAAVQEQMAPARQTVSAN